MKLADLDFDKDEDDISSPKDRVPMIKKVFKLVLNREPSSRELSFYKYGTQDRNEITEKLINDKEHKESLEKAKKFSKIEEELKDSKHTVVKLKQKIEDMEEEANQTKNLLDQKNKEIAILRREKQDPYNFTHSEALKYIRGLTENSRTNVNQATQVSTNETHFSSISTSDTQESRKKNFIDKIYEFLRTS